MSETKVTPNAGNGYNTENYTWNQTATDIDLTVPLQSQVCGKDVAVTVTKLRLVLSVYGKTVIDREFEAGVRARETIWSVEDGCTVAISLVKLEQLWWKRMFKDDPELDSSKVTPPPVKMADLDPEGRAIVEKMFCEQLAKNK